MHKVKIKIRAFPYYVTRKNPVSQQDETQELIARRGDEIELSDADYDRAQRFNAIETEADQQVAEATGGAAFSVQTATTEELADWLRSDKPTVQQVLDSVGDDPALAQRVLEAENLATGQDPRSTLVDGLNEVVSSNASDDEEEDE